MVLQFGYPLDAQPRVSILGVPAAGGSAESVSEADCVAAPARILSGLTVPGWEPLYPVVAFTGPQYGFLSAADRDRIWMRWGVPVFEQLISKDLKVIAEECDAHDGIHLRDPRYGVEQGELVCAGTPVGVAAVLITAPCPCGDPSPRLANIAASKQAAAACA